MARKARNRPAPRKAQGKEELSKQSPGTGRAVFWAALYIRLSKADAGTPGADTVENQRALLEDYVKKQADIKVSGIYLDHGYSGTGFRRPAFMKMMEDARGGKVNCIIVKDFSRFDGKMEPDEEAADTVRLIFTLPLSRRNFLISPAMTGTA